MDRLTDRARMTLIVLKSRKTINQSNSQHDVSTTSDAMSYDNLL